MAANLLALPPEQLANASSTHTQSSPPTHRPRSPNPSPLCLLQNELPEQLANSSNTIAWWQGRQAEVQERLSKRRAAPSPKPAEQVGRCF